MQTAAIRSCKHVIQRQQAQCKMMAGPTWRRRTSHAHYTTTGPTSSMNHNAARLPFQLQHPFVPFMCLSSIIGIAAVVNCESAKEPSEDQLKEQQSTAPADVSEPLLEQEDSFDDLPEDDEPTSCSICNINREGPCRSLWRRFERCMKSQSDEKKESDSADKTSASIEERCDNLMMPWITCFQDNKEIYTALTNKFYQMEFLDDAESAFEDKDKMCWADTSTNAPDVDWSNWIKYLEDHKMTTETLFTEYFLRNERELFLENQLKEMEKRGVKPKRVWYEDQPPLSECRARVALKDSATDLPIEVAYARDQDGKILGFEMFNSDKKEGKKEAALIFYVHLAETKSVKICAIYKQEPVIENNSDAKEMTGDDDNASTEKKLEKRLYYSKPISVLQPMAEADLLRTNLDVGAESSSIRWQDITERRKKTFEPPKPSDEVKFDKE